MKINVAGIYIDILSDFLLDWVGFDSFLSTDSQTSDARIVVNKLNFIKEPLGNSVLSENLKWYRKPDNSSGYFVYINDDKNTDIVNMLEVNNDWTKGSITFLESSSHNRNVIPLSVVFFRNKLLFHQGITMHASAIKWNGNGILFTAPSGVGKSTMANLWKTYKNALILNGDSPSIRVIDGSPIVYGTPWSGSESEFVNDRAPLKAIIVLEQALTNEIRPLTSYEIVSMVLRRFFLPYFDKHLMIKAIDIFEKIVQSVPVYLLKCRPDFEAVDLVYQCVK